MSREDEDRFAGFVATLGRGPGRSRALTREEAREAFALVLAGRADPHQVGAFLMLLRYRGEDADEVAGLVEAARADAGIGQAELGAALDWPSYGAGCTRGVPWFVLSALALSQARTPVLMHGSNAFSTAIPVADALAALGMRPCASLDEAAFALRQGGFAYLPLPALSPRLDRLLGMRRLFGLRSPVNTVARLLDPANAPACIDGVFHPAYIHLHLGLAEGLGRRRLLVLKGAGGEAERTPAKSVTAFIWSRDSGRSELCLPAAGDLPAELPDAADVELMTRIWRGQAIADRPLAIIRATIALGLLATGREADPVRADEQAEAIWAMRHQHGL